jgi:hypothetical protein
MMNRGAEGNLIFQKGPMGRWLMHRKLGNDRIEIGVSMSK